MLAFLDFCQYADVFRSHRDRSIGIIFPHARRSYTHDSRALLTNVVQYPETATFLTEDERKSVLQTLKEDRMGQPTHASSKFVWQAMTDWKTYVQCIIFLGSVILSFLCRFLT
jgi:hypothetical protein